jgi:hypothetical protein
MAEVSGVPAPKVQFVDDYARLTGRPVNEVRARVRRLFIDGYGPRGDEPLTDATMADFFLAFVGAEQHIDAIHAVRRLPGFRLIGDPRRTGDLPELAAELERGTLRSILTNLIRNAREDVAPRLVDIAAWWPPADKVVLRISKGDDTLPLSLSFGSQPDIVKALRDTGETYPEQTVRILSGHVVAGLAHLSVADAYTQGYRYDGDY